MRVVIQRVSSASVRVDGETVGSVDGGLLLLVAVGGDDLERDVDAAVEKVAHLRIFPDEEGRMNRSVLDVSGGVLVVSQFTLLADVRRGRRPSFTSAAHPRVAEPLVDRLISGLTGLGLRVERGVFGAKMEVDSTNDGPVTIVLDVKRGAVG